MASLIRSGPDGLVSTFPAIGPFRAGIRGRVRVAQLKLSKSGLARQSGSITSTVRSDRFRRRASAASPK